MNIENYEFTNGITGKTLSVLKEGGKKYDEIAEKIFRADCPYFCADVSEVSVNGKTYFRYDLGNYMPIADMNLRMSRGECIHLLKNMLLPFNESYDWMIKSQYFVMKKEFVFINSLDYGIKYIYTFDTANGSADFEINNFFYEMIKEITINDSPDFHNILLQMLVKGNVSVAALNDLVKRYEKDGKMQGQRFSTAKPITNTAQKSPSAAPAPVLSKQAETPKIETPPQRSEPVIQTPQESPEPAQREVYNPTDKLASEKSDTMEKLFGGSKKQPKKNSAQKEKNTEKKESIFSGFLKRGKSAQETPEYDDEPTSIGGDDENTTFGPSGACLILIGNPNGVNIPERIDVVLNGNGEMKIGRQSQKGNNEGFTFSPSLTQISRDQSRIYRNGSEYFIVDLGSKGGTIVNGTAIPPNTAERLEDGTTVMLGREFVYEFHFV